MNEIPPKPYEEITVKPLKFLPALGFFLIVAAIMIAMYYVVYPRWLGRFGAVNGYIFSSLAALFTVLFVSIAFFYYLGDKNHPATWEVLRIRFSLKKLAWNDWKWILIIIIPNILLTFGLGTLFRWLIDVFNISIPFPGNYESSTIESLLKPTIFQGVMMLALLLVNIAAEELFFRGYLYPRQEKVHGKWTWVIHSVMWWLVHAHNWFNFPTFMFNSLLIPLVWHKTKNTSATLISHFIGNATSLAVLYILAYFF